MAIGWLTKLRMILMLSYINRKYTQNAVFGIVLIRYDVYFLTLNSFSHGIF